VSAAEVNEYQNAGVGCRRPTTCVELRVIGVGGRRSRVQRLGEPIATGYGTAERVVGRRGGECCGPEKARAPIARGTARTERVNLVPVIMSLFSN